MTGTALHREYGLLAVRGLLIAGAVIWIYSPAFQGGWIWDDSSYLSSHLRLHDPNGWWKNWLEPGLHEDYFPIESTVLRWQWHLWHNDTLGYHLTNVLLHILAAFLVWRLLGKIGVRPAWLGGLIFAIHPMMVDSVAWAVELKNSLSLPPLLLAMCVFLDYEENKRNRDYWLALGLFLVAMLCKVSVMMLPTVILLHAWWKRGRIGRSDLNASAPFFAISLPLGLLGGWLHHQTGTDTAVVMNLPARLATLGWEILIFPFKCLFPVGLLPIYPGAIVTSPAISDFFPWLTLIGLFGVLWLKRDGWGRHALLGLGFFLLNLTPVFAFILMNAPTMVWTVDHLTYISIIGLIGLFVAAWSWMAGRISPALRLFYFGVTAVAMASLAWESHENVKIFRDEDVFWNYELLHDPGSRVVHANVGVLALHQGRLIEAKEQFEQALRIDPKWYEAHSDLGLALQQMGRLPEAEAEYDVALKADPNFAPTHVNLAVTLLQSGRIPEAIDQFGFAVRLDPDQFEVRYALGNALAQADRLPEAMEQYEIALKLNPDFAEAHYSLGNALIQTGRLPEAIVHYEEALRIKPDYADAHVNLGNALLQLGRLPQAVEQYEQALRITARDVDVRNTLGLVLMKTGRISEAAGQFEAVLQIDPKNAKARDQLAKIRAMTKTGAP